MIILYSLFYDLLLTILSLQVTDKTMLEEVMNGTMTIKDGRIKDNGYIYMILEYGETDLAHMLSQQWKEIDGSNTKMDENWLRFYWQVFCIHIIFVDLDRLTISKL